ncbi:MAG: histidine phosphatase family protein [Candidatus Tectomicrobia bacterium]|uniref:Histidine phosphatase family protein n=1 Tax=Tectimicrobiota bacterium TaxID=2528274 RepID=A0A938AZ86_UNCTE|nr:histidine phosphatase family protein [Candidatus Tectomicrobia bacterium]
MADTPRTKVVYFVRHGQSEDNVAPVFQAPDSPLSVIGRVQAARIAERVSHLTFDALLASPYRRAQETAAIIGHITGKAPEGCALFIERVKPSSINGKPFTDPQAEQVGRVWTQSLSTPGMRVEDGENYDDLLRRADAALAFLRDRAESSIVVVTHGYFLRTLVARVLLGNALSGEAFQHFHTVAAMENTGLTVLRYQAGFAEEPCWRLWIYNDHAHLAD